MTSYPTPADVARPEVLGPHFTKYHLHGTLLHRFTEAQDEYPHDHPYSFTSHVLSGGYVEEIYTLHSDGSHSVALVERHAGTSHQVSAGTVHRLVGLLGSECWTLCEPGPAERTSGFYRFTERGIEHRYWHEADWQPWPRP